jgi:hypothetical protein
VDQRLIQIEPDLKRERRIAATLVSGFNADAHAAPKHAPAGQYYESRGWVSGFLLRASMVCGDKYDWKAMARVGMDLLYAGTKGTITNGSPDTVKAWGTQGANLFNNGVMTDGVDAACSVASQNLVKARAIIANELR